MSPDSDASTSRRAFLGGAATLAATAALPTAAAQDGGKFTTAAIPDSAPTFDGDDYVGLFLHIAGPGESKGSEGVQSCEFAASGDEELVTWDAMLVHKSGENAEEKITLHAKQGGDAMQGGRLFVVNGQTDCDDGFVQVQLEQVGASKVEYSGAGTSTGGGGGGDGESNADSPGFGPVAGLVGLLGAGWLATRRGD